jgi:small-conductance mechanosensitive channel
MLVCVLSALSPLAAAAATPPVGAEQAATVELPQPLTREAIRELVARMSDGEVRALLVAQLDKAAAPTASPPAASMATGLAGDVDRARTELGAIVRAVPGIPADLGAAVSRFSVGRSSYQLLVAAVGFAVMLAVGFLAERLVRPLLAGLGNQLERARPPGHGVEGGYGVTRVVVEFLLLAVFAMAAFATFLSVYQGHEATRELIVSALLAAVQARLAILVARLLLAPTTPTARALPFDDAAAGTLYRGVVSLACLYAVLDVTAFALERWAVPRESFLLLVILFRVLFVVLFLRLVWRVREPIAAMIRGRGQSALRRTLADLWAVLMTVYVLGLLVTLTLGDLAGQSRAGRAGVLSLLVVIALPVVDMALCRLVDRRVVGAPSGREPGFEAFRPVLRQAVHIVVTVVGVLVVVHVWQIDLMGMATAGAGARVARMLIDTGLTLMLAYLIWQLARTAIDRRLERELGPRSTSDPGEPGGTGASRLRTLLPLARGTVFVVICVMSVMSILAALGVNIGPLLAGAGVVGLAVGFGAQTLVRDIISGAFYLMDDAFRLGEYIDVGDAKGTVERIGIRSMQLRHHRGPVNIVPYGAIRRMTNQSRDWVIEKLEFHLTYDTDIAKVKKIIKRIGQELTADPELSPHIIEPLKSQGVFAMEDSGMLVRAKFTAKPGQQFVIRREAYQRIKQAFDAAGIRFAHRQVTVFVPPDAAGSAGSAAARGAAAAVAAEPPADRAS